MTEQPTVEILVGMLASGKSTYAAKRAAEGAIIVNDDAVVTAVHGGDYSRYDKRLRPLYKSTEMHIAQMALSLGRSVVIDRGVNVSVAARRRWIGLASAFDADVVAVVFARMGAYQHAVRRHLADGRSRSFAHWEQAAARHAADWEHPTLDEGLDLIREEGP